MQLDLNLYPLLLLPSLPASNVHLVHNVHHFLKLYYFFLDDDSVFYLFSLLLQNHVFQINASCCICFLSILTTSQPGMSRQASFVKVKFRRKNMTNGVTTTPWRIPPVLPLLLIPTTNAKPVLFFQVIFYLVQMAVSFPKYCTFCTVGMYFWTESNN